MPGQVRGRRSVFPLNSIKAAPRKGEILCSALLLFYTESFSVLTMIILVHKYPMYAFAEIIIKGIC